jgi:hypothetical protein
MKHFFIFLFLVLFDLCHSQAEKSFSIYFHPAIANQDYAEATSSIQINNVKLLSGSVPVSIASHYPLFDTIYFLDTNQRINPQLSVITRFKNGERYAFVPSCCTSVDIVKAERTDEYMKEFSRWYGDTVSDFAVKFADPIHVSFKLTSAKPVKDTILGVFAEWSGFPYAIVFKKNQQSKFYGPGKGFYWNNITEIIIAEPKNRKITTSKNDPNRTEDIWIDNIEVLQSLQLRFFNGEKVLVTYDIDKKRTTVTLQK